MQVDDVYLIDVKDRRYRGVWKIVGFDGPKIVIRQLTKACTTNMPPERYVTLEFLQNVGTPLLRDDSCLITGAGSLTPVR